MRVITSLQEWIEIRSAIRDKSIGFVPTMGALHQGHFSLVEKSNKDNEITVVSIFVNPTQFNCQSDYVHYPKTVEADLKHLEVFNVDYVLMPSEEALYPEGRDFLVTVNSELSQKYEGRVRPGHFNGVMTIVLKLLNVVSPKRAYFGEKDYQQVALVQSLAKAFFLPVEVIVCPTVRLGSKLPYSSRNARLTEEERRLAEEASRRIHTLNEENLIQVQEWLIEKGIGCDYLALEEGRAFSAIRIGSIRLIDNFQISERSS